MKKGLSALMIVLLLLICASPATAESEMLDIEKAAIQSVNNSQDIQSINRKIKKVEETKGSLSATVDMMRASLQYANDYNIVMNILLLPLQIDNQVTQIWNTEGMITNAVRMGAYKAYTDLLKAEYTMNIQLSLMNEAEASVEKAKLQEPLGLISQLDLQLTEISYEKARHLYDSAKKTYESTRITLNQMMGQDLDKEYAKLRDNNIYPPQLKALQVYTDRALRNRGEIVNARSNLEYAEKAYEYGKANSPADYQYYVQQQEYDVENAQNELELANIKVQKDIVDKYKNLEAAIKAMDARKSLLEQAEITYHATEIQYQNNQISLLQLDNAKVEKAQADINYKNALLDAWLVQMMMDSACDIGIYQ